MGEESKSANGTTYPTDDLYYIAAVKALCGVNYDEVVIVEADLYGKKEKCVAIYKNQKLLPAPSHIKLSYGTTQITLREFTDTFIQSKRELFRILDQHAEEKKTLEKKTGDRDDSCKDDL